MLFKPFQDMVDMPTMLAFATNQQVLSLYYHLAADLTNNSIFFSVLPVYNLLLGSVYVIEKTSRIVKVFFIILFLEHVLFIGISIGL